LLRIEAVDTAHIDRGHGGAVRRLGFAEGTHPANRAEMMADTVRVERIGGEILFRRLQYKSVTRHESEKVAAFRAQGAIAFDHFGDRRLRLEVEGDLSAMASAAILHVCPPRPDALRSP